MTITGTPKTLGKEEELILFRIVQEVAGWMIDKTGTSLLSVTIQYEPVSVLISIRAHETEDREERPDDEDPVIKKIEQRSFIIGARLQTVYINSNETVVNVTLPV